MKRRAALFLANLNLINWFDLLMINHYLHCLIVVCVIREYIVFVISIQSLRDRHKKSKIEPVARWRLNNHKFLFKNI